MNNLPYELVAVIGDHLAPKWRCRLFICCKLWRDKCYDVALFTWCSNNKKNIIDINRINYNDIKYLLKGNRNKVMYVSMRIVPHWKNRRMIWSLCLKQPTIINLNLQEKTYVDRGGYISRICTSDVSDYRSGYIRRDYKYIIAEYYTNDLSYHVGNAEIIFNNIKNIMKYLNIYDIFRLWISLGFGYYHILECKYYDAYFSIRRYRDAYNRLKKELINNSFIMK